MKVRFLADADLNKAIVNGVLRRESSLDFLTAQAAQLRGMSDIEVLALAAEQRRVLVSHDVGTMPPHFSAFRKSENRARAYSSFRSAWTSEWQSTNSWWFGRRRKRRTGTIGWCGYHCKRGLSQQRPSRAQTAGPLDARDEEVFHKLVVGALETREIGL